MSLQTQIESTLRAAWPTPGMGRLLAYMAHNGYYTELSSSHNHWPGGAAEHMWTCYQIAITKKSDILKDRQDLLPYATDDKLAIVCLLHDLCDMKVTVHADDAAHHYDDVSNRHGYKSYWIMRNHGIGTEAEREAVRDHMHEHAKCDLNDTAAKAEYEALHTIICKVDHMASGVAWNSEQFSKGLTQHTGVPSSPGYLRAVAMDRTKQSLENHIYLDFDMLPHTIKGYNRDHIQWNSHEAIVAELQRSGNMPDENDIITMLHNQIQGKKRVCLVVGIELSIPKAANTRLRGRNYPEQNLLICSNILNSFYLTETSIHHHYGFTMRDEIVHGYQQQKPDKGIYLPKVTFFRDGPSEGFRMVAPWTCDVLLVSGWKGVQIIALPE